MRLIGAIAFGMALSASSSSTVSHSSSSVQHPGRAAGVARHTASSERLAQAYAQLPLQFEANRGQTDQRVDFLSRGAGYALFLSSNEAVLRLSRRQPTSSARGAMDDGKRQSAILRMKLVHANEHAEPEPSERLWGTVNYFMGNDPARWHTNVPTYAKAIYRGVYRGIDVVYYGNQGQLEYDFIVRPGSSPKTIGLDFAGADRVDIDDKGALVLHTAAGAVLHSPPQIYQMVDGRRHEVAGGYVLTGRSRISFDVAEYDTSQPLVIDPTLVYSTLLGDSDLKFDSGASIAVDDAGKVYVAGSTQSASFPTTLGAFDTTHAAGADAFVAKLNASGTALEYSTFLGGTGLDAATGIAFDALGNVYTAGSTWSADFPTTVTAFDGGLDGMSDAFVAKLDASGALLMYSTYLGGSGSDEGFGVAVHRSGHAYIAGTTTSNDFPTTRGAFDTTRNGTTSEDIFVTRLNPSGSTAIYSTYLGGAGRDVATGIAVGAAGGAYVIGTSQSADYPITPGAYDITMEGGGDAVVTRLHPSGSILDYSTYLGGGAFDTGQGLALDASGQVYVTGLTASTDFPATVGAFDTSFNGGALDAYVTKLNAAGSGVIYSTLLGGSGTDNGLAVAVDSSGNAYVAGWTTSRDFPAVRSLQPSYAGELADAFVTKLNATGSALLYSTNLGGFRDDRAYGIAVDVSQNAYVTGGTSAPNVTPTPGEPTYPTTPGAFNASGPSGRDAFITKIGDP